MAIWLRACLLSLMLAMVAAGPAWARAGGTPPASTASSEAPRISADAAVLLDARSGRVLYERAAHQRRDPASTTKMMTAVLALELGNPSDVVYVSRAAAATPGSSAHISVGDRYRLGDLVEGLLMRSGNDAAVAIAQHVAGSVPAFAALMNQRARLLGMRDTSFVNPHGLTAAGHTTSAYDLALLARYALTVPAFSRVVAARSADMPGLARDGDAILHRLRSTNRLLYSYGWVTGVKTGTTARAGSCLVASASKDGGELIAVVLHSDNRWDDALSLLQWGFAAHRFEDAVPVGTTLAHVPVADGRLTTVPAVAAADLPVAVTPDEAAVLNTVVSVAPGLSAPVQQGQVLGSVSVLAGDELLGSAPLVAGRAVAPRRWWSIWRPRS